MDNYAVYKYAGPVLDQNGKRIDTYVGSTTAVSRKQALNHFRYRVKSENNLPFWPGLDSTCLKLADSPSPAKVEEAEEIEENIPPFMDQLTIFDVLGA